MVGGRDSIKKTAERLKAHCICANFALKFHLRRYIRTKSLKELQG